MPIRSARRLQPALTAFLAGVLLLCAYLMSGPGHADTMSMPAAMDSTAGRAGMPAMANGSDPSYGPAVSEHGADSCPMTAMECPLASAQPPAAPVLFAAPGPALEAEAPGAAARSARPLGASCAWPRAPDPVSLLCVSRT
ncbi:hypothetical protein Snoj_17660 [Streptomyces nojiriensis]|uniref:DUF2946 domain-containing protein n=1 Tax=Streptomyces nojiriensis TaxID=66374 RepID=A0ABQ3SI81_9ACTN|nr:hypothetical protein [Streptomyces nojiriensis]QTI49468.1 hypothetical protein JYK04_07340 [Streptomyces nojiriensis]GGS35306.1 hypothetical protein GCM10010205_76790 [Streptomyces nojiriensis]GHI67848.1 hypothetical protein Snoj_17660 [Streptomyces nojiriensis]